MNRNDAWFVHKDYVRQRAQRMPGHNEGWSI
jgi:hypothetical protein